MKITPVLGLLLGSTVIAHSAAAGELAFVPPSPVVVEAPSSPDWQGFYLGAQYAWGDGELGAYENGVYNYTPYTSGELYGGFAGYNAQSGKLVYGVEASYMTGEMSDPDNSHTITTTDTIDLKARVGFAAGSALIYGFAGYSVMTMFDSSGAEPAPLSGLNYGLGLDFKLGDRFFIGADYTIRELSGEFDQVLYPGWTAEGPVSTVALRVGVKF